MTQTNVVTWAVGDKRYSVDLFDIDGLEWRDAKRATGMNHQQAVAVAAIAGDFEAIAAVLWVVRRRDEPGLSYEDVLKGLSWASMVPDGQEDESPPA